MENNNYRIVDIKSFVKAVIEKYGEQTPIPTNDWREEDIIGTLFTGKEIMYIYCTDVLAMEKSTYWSDSIRELKYRLVREIYYPYLIKLGCKSFKDALLILGKE